MAGPIRKMLDEYAAQGLLRMHMPGHKGKIGIWDTAQDVTEVDGTDSLYEPNGCLREAERLATERWQAASANLLVNGSTAGIQAMVLWAKQQGSSLVLPRNCHLSVVHACALAGVQPIWLEPAWSRAQQTHAWDGKATLSVLDRVERPALLSVYPTYFGCCADVGALANAVPDAVFLTDEAHGAHFVFSDRLPSDAGSFSTLWVAGAHKTLPAPTQTAWLLCGSRANAGDVKRILRAITTTSPSYLLMAGLDDARATMEERPQDLERTIDLCQSLRTAVNAIAGLHCWGLQDILALGYRALDPTRLTVDVQGLGMTGWQAQSLLRRVGVQAEMADSRRIVFIITVMDEELDLERLLKALKWLATQHGTGTPSGLDELPASAPAEITLRQALLSPAVDLPLVDSTGRIAAEPFGAYPPGIALCMPGERITGEVVAMADALHRAWGSLFGVRDGLVSVIA